MIESFEHAARLDRETLEATLARGLPHERIWAIWALAMRTDGAPLARGVTREPDAGVRRTLAVLLAGHGEVELLIGLARHDPSPAVRESAIQLAGRLANGGALAPPDVIALATTPASQIALLGAIGRDAPAAFVELAQRLLTSAAAVALEAFEALLRIDTKAAYDEARAWMLRRPDIRDACDHWLRAANAETLAEAVAGSTTDHRRQALECMRAPTWKAARMLVGDDTALLRIVIDRDDIAIPAHVLARAILAGSHHCVYRLTAKLAAAADGRSLLADLRAAVDREHDLGKLHARARRYADGLDIANAAELLEEVAGHHPVEHLLGLENAVSRWLSNVDAPPALVPMLPELGRYCARETHRRDERAPFRDLAEAIARLR